MNYYTTDAHTEDCFNVINDIVKPDDTLFILTIDRSASSIYHNQENINCNHLVFCDAPWLVTYRDTAFDIPIKIALNAMPILKTGAQSDQSNIQLYGEADSTSIKDPTMFSVHWDIWHKPVTVEDILKAKFGYHVNPYTGYIEHVRAFEKAYAEFLDKFNKETW